MAIMSGLTPAEAWDGTIALETARTTQLEPGRLFLDRSVTELGSLRCVSLSTDVAFSGHSDLLPGRTIIGIRADSSTDARWFGERLDFADVIQTQTSMDLTMHGHSKMYFVASDIDKVESNDGCRIHRNAEYAGALRCYLGAAIYFSCAGAGENRRLRIIEQALPPLLDLCLSENSTYEPRWLGRRVVAVHKCEDFVLDHLDENPTLSDLCAISGMSSRTLVNAFQAVTGMSPMTYLRVHRLNGVRKALLTRGPSKTRVMDIAADWGFWHMGHFAANYRKMFGESPSETLNRRSKLFISLER